MDFGKYEKYMNDRKAVTVENNRRIEKKFAECEKWVADNLKIAVVSLQTTLNYCRNKVL